MTSSNAPSVSPDRSDFDYDSDTPMPDAPPLTPDSRSPNFSADSFASQPDDTETGNGELPLSRDYSDMDTSPDGCLSDTVPSIASVLPPSQSNASYASTSKATKLAQLESALRGHLDPETIETNMSNAANSDFMRNLRAGMAAASTAISPVPQSDWPTQVGEESTSSEDYPSGEELGKLLALCPNLS
jgi:hypothetical protein